MNLLTCFNNSTPILMEGSIGERLKREYNIQIDKIIALASLVYDQNARSAMESIYNEYMKTAEKYNLPLMITTTTRRVNYDLTYKAGFNEDIIKDNVDFLRRISDKSTSDIFLGGMMGCKGDAYKATDVLQINEAFEFHLWQVNLFKKAKVDYLYAAIMPALSEAIGIAKAMETAELPYIISFMIRNNGKLIDGTNINDALNEIDNNTKNKPLCYMVNCVHPSIVKSALSFDFNKTDIVRKRFGGIQANTSPLPPEELDNCIDLKTSDSNTLANEIMDLNNFINLKIFGGCCGTDNTHIEELARRLKDKIKG